jgi:uncharacterized Zn finger protein
MSTLPISEAIIRHNSNASSYDRGEDYYRRGAVYDVKKRGNQIQASVEGSEIKPYRVSVNFDAGGITLAWDDLAEYGGDCYSIAAPLNIAWTEAILCADIPEAQATDLQVAIASVG